MSRHWELCLEAPPEILMMAFGFHLPQAGYDCYRLPDLWCLHFYRYNGELRINGEGFAIRPGYCSLTPPNALLEYSYHQSPSVHSVAHFRLPAKISGPLLSLPAMRDLGRDFETLVGSFEEAIAWRGTQPGRVVARVWDVLWQLNEWKQSDSASPVLSVQPAIERARQEIEMRLSTPLCVKELAARAGFSHNHFTRLFCAGVGSTPSQYIRARRVERAAHLLKNSTLPIKVIAAQCGLGDLQAFNKIIRRDLEMSPRECRRK